MRETLPLLLLAACAAPSVPEQPTWADVEPILRGNCTQCHGASAAVDGRAGDTVVRFDFFEMTDAQCGDAAAAMPTAAMAHGLAPLIASAVEAPSMGGRARMPPAPAPALESWERETIVRWAANPTLGEPPRNNRRPQITLAEDFTGTADAELAFTALVDDPDGEPVVGVLTLGAERIDLPGPGSFHVHVDTSAWAPGHYPARALLCDGWDQVAYTLPDVVVIH